MVCFETFENVDRRCVCFSCGGDGVVFCGFDFEECDMCGGEGVLAGVIEMKD